jgi:hypothetical protein
MMSQWKKSLKLIKYGYQFKTNMILSLIFLLFGILILVTENSQSVFTGYTLGALYVVLAQSLMLQLLKGVLSCGIAAAAPKRRYMEIQMEDKGHFLIGTFSYAIVLIILGIKVLVVPNHVGKLAVPVLYVAATIMLLIIYMGIAYKTFIVGTILFVACWIVIFDGCIGKFGKLMADRFGLQIEFSTPISIVLGLLLVWLGVVLSGLLRRALYKRPISKFATGVMMRKQM